MITSKTYNGISGKNYIQNSELAFATIYVVKRSGIQYDQYVSGSANRTYVHDSSAGKILFPISFDPDNPEKVFVIFKTPSVAPEPEIPPGVCVPAGFVGDSTLPDGIVGVAYNKTINLSGTQPFTITPGSKPSWMAITNSADTISHTGTPDVTGNPLVSYNIGSCGSSVLPFSQNITVYGPTANFYVSNLSTAGVVITKVIGLPRTLLTGTFPIHYLSGVTGVHADYTGIVTVFITGIVFPFTLSLYKNAVLLEAITVTTDDSYSFAEQSFLSADQSVIILN